MTVVAALWIGTLWVSAISAALLQSLTEPFDSRIIATGGGLFLKPHGQLLKNYAVWKECDSIEALKGGREWIDEAGYPLSGCSLAETNSKDAVIGGHECWGFEIPTWKASAQRLSMV